MKIAGINYLKENPEERKDKNLKLNSEPNNLKKNNSHRDNKHSHNARPNHSSSIDSLLDGGN